MIPFDKLSSFLADFPRLTIALVGDLFLDRYLEIDSKRSEPSIETGLTAYQVVRVRNAPGALGTVMNNLAALGVGKLLPVTVIGDDGHGYDLRRELERLPVDPSRVLLDPARLTPTYTKPLVPEPDGSWRELHRLDVRSRGSLSESVQRRLLACIHEVFDLADALIVLDQVHEEGCGVVGPAVRRAVGDLARAWPEKLVYIDSRAHLGRFHGGVLKGNRQEILAAGALLGEVPADKRPDESELDAAVRSAAQALCARTNRTVFCTLGARGILVVPADAAATLVPAVPVTPPIDIVGAGDSATAGMVAALALGATDVEAAALGNLVASITIQQLGTTGTASPQQVLARWRER